MSLMILYLKVHPSDMPKIRIHPLFLIFAIFVILSGHFFLFINMLIAVIIHELAHAKIARSRGYVIDKMTFMPYGAVLSGKENITKDNAIAIYIAGPIYNAIIGLMIIAIWWIIPIIYNYTRIFVASNLILALFNLLPIYPLDGSKIIMNLFKNKIKILVIMKYIGIIVSLSMFILFIISAFIEINLTLGIISIFLFAGAVIGNNREKYHHLASNAPFVKNYTEGLKKDNIMILSTMPLYKILKFIKPNTVNTFSVIDKDYKVIRVINENEMLDIFENYEITTQIGKIFNNIS